MMKAIEIAKLKMSENEYPFGCCIVYKDTCIVESNTCFTSGNPLDHAEMKAISQLVKIYGYDVLKKSVLYATTEPCLMCFGALNWAHIPRLVYGTSVLESSQLGFDEMVVSIEELKSKMSYSLEVKGGVLYEECKELLLEWDKRNKLIRRLFKREGEVLDEN